MSDSSASSRKLPCVVHVGFAGSRQLFELPDGSDNLLRQLDEQVQQRLFEVLQSLKQADPARPNFQLEEHHCVCGISQIAIGADTLFTRACHQADVLQRIFLPTHREAYLSGINSHGKPDFTPLQIAEAIELLGSPHIIQERVVSGASDRIARFGDCNQEIVRVSDLVICLVRANAESKPGGTLDLLRMAISRNIPALVIQVSQTGENVACSLTWHLPKTDSEKSLVPKLPDFMADLSIPTRRPTIGISSVVEFCETVEDHTSQLAKDHRDRFDRAARVIIRTHVWATFAATAALALHGLFSVPAGVTHHAPNWLLILLVAELALLVFGFQQHDSIHRSHLSHSRALSRLLSEILRSVKSLGGLHFYLEYLFRVGLPPEVVPMLRTLNVLYLRSTRGNSDTEWKSVRDEYVRARLTDPQTGQLAYYRDRSEQESQQLKRAHWFFMTFCLFAIVATAAKFGILKFDMHLGGHAETITVMLGSIAILAPVFAVGWLSWAAAQDYEARAHTYAEIVSFLTRQQSLIQDATSAREFLHLVEDTELKLLGEVSNWFIRCRFRGVA